MATKKTPSQKDLTGEVAAATAIRSAWGYDSVAGGLSPTRLADIIRSANDGDMNAYLTLAEEMEERDPHYSSVMRTRRLAVTGLDIEVIAAGDSAKDKEIAEDIRHITQKAEFYTLINDLMDAIGKGYSVAEIMWERGSKWTPKKFIWRDPRFFMPHPKRPDELRIVDEADYMNGLEIPPYKFVIHKPSMKAGLALRGGLARLVALSYVCKMYGLKDWLAFAEVYGKPIRIGRYGNSATPNDKKVLKSALATLGSDAAAILPVEMEVEIVEAVKGATGGNVVFEKLVNWLDRQVSKAVLGQTMTTDDGSSMAQANVHNDVRLDLIEADAKQLAATINRDFIKPYIDINYGEQESYPRIKILLPDNTDLDAEAGRLETLVNLGLPVSKKQAYERFGVAPPENDEDTLQGGGKGPFDQSRAENRAAAPGCPSCGKAKNTADTQADDVDLAVEDMMGDWQRVMSPALEAVRKAVNSATSLEDLRDALGKMSPEIDTSELVTVLATATFKQHGDGIEGSQ